MTQPSEPTGHGLGHWVDDAHRYRLDSRIATGGMGEVWRATDTVLGREVAVKILKAEYADDATFRSRFETEARHAASLAHQGIAAVYDFGEASGTDASSAPRPYLVMELVKGEPLSALLRPGAPLDPDATRDLLSQVGDALGVAHRAGIVHRDVKPANLLVTPDRRIKVTDFGIARAMEGMALTQTGQVMGTPQYLSPEQAEGGTATPASDVYSLGVVAFECLVGRRPFEADSPVATALAHLRQPVPEIPGHVPTALAAVVRRALDKDPAVRFADGTAFAAALRNPESASGVPASRPATAPAGPAGPASQATTVMPATTATPAEPRPPALTNTDELPSAAGPGSSGPSWPLIVAGVALLVFLVGAAWWWSTGQRADPEPPEPTRSQAPTPDKEPSKDSKDEAIEVDESDYVGRDVRDVARELSRMGLRVVREERTNPGEETPNQVTSVNPTGSLNRGDSVTVAFWGKPPAEKPTPTPEPTPTPTPTPTNTPTPTPAPTPTPEPTPTPTPEPAPTTTPALAPPAGTPPSVSPPPDLTPGASTTTTRGFR